MKPHRLVADDGSTKTDVGGMERAKTSPPAGCAAVAHLSAGTREALQERDCPSLGDLAHTVLLWNYAL